jgi:hypothetical protein
MADASPTPWYRKVGFVLGWFLLWPTIPFVMAFILAIGLYAVIAIFTGEILFSLRMHQSGRFRRWRALGTDFVNGEPGTLIIESPSLGWGFTHAWWTPEDVSACCPYQEPSEDEYFSAASQGRCPDWDHWLWQNYANPIDGKGFLLRVLNGHRLEPKVRQLFPTMRVAHTWTALVHRQKSPAQPKGDVEQP